MVRSSSATLHIALLTLKRLKVARLNVNVTSRLERQAARLIPCNDYAKAAHLCARGASTKADVPRDPVLEPVVHGESRVLHCTSEHPSHVETSNERSAVPVARGSQFVLRSRKPG